MLTHTDSNEVVEIEITWQSNEESELAESFKLDSEQPTFTFVSLA